MNAQTKSQIPPRRLGHSILALLAGIGVGIVLSVGTDVGLHAIGVAPAQSERWPNQLLLLATLYRSIYGVIGAYVIARLAPNRLMGHALVAGALGLVVSTLGGAAMWSSTIGQHWYSVTLALTTLPTAWIGAKLRMMQLQIETRTA
jgi:hypothetical protein